MIGGAIAQEDVGSAMLSSALGKMDQPEMDGLWEVFDHIGRTWGAEDANPLYQRSQWLEFLHVKTQEDPSYVGEYRNGVEVLRELHQLYQEEMWHKLFFEHGVGDSKTSRLAHLRKFVVEEFIQVWLTSGGFKTYGAGNYNSYVSGSRFAVTPAYRRLPTSPQAPNPQTESLSQEEK